MSKKISYGNRMVGITSLFSIIGNDTSSVIIKSATDYMDNIGANLENIEMKVYGRTGYSFGSKMLSGKLALYGNCSDYAASGMKGGEIFIYGNHDALRNYLSFDEFSEIILRVCLNKIPGLITCTAKNNLRFSEIASKVCDVFNRKHKFLFLKNKDDLVDVISPYPHLFYERICFHPIANMDEIFYKIAMIYK